MRPPLESLRPLSVDGDGNDDEETEGDNKSKFDNADEDPEPEPAPPLLPAKEAAARGVEGEAMTASAEIRSSEQGLGLG